MPQAKNIADELRKARIAREKAHAKQARIAEMPERERQKRHEQKLRIEQLRRERIEREKQENDEIRKRVKRRMQEEREQEEEANKKRKLEAVQALQVTESVQTGASNNIESEKRMKPSKKRVKFEDNDENTDHVEQSPTSVVQGGFFGTISRSEIDSAYGNYAQSNDTEHVSKVKLDDVLNMGAHRVFYSTTERGGGLIGRNMGRWSTPDGWSNLIFQLNELLEKNARSVDFAYGEYNYVIRGTEIHKHLGFAPTLMDTQGNDITMNEFVIRFTKPTSKTTPDPDSDGTENSNELDTSTPPETEVCRYRSYRSICTEMNNVLNAAANGFGVPCYAAFAYKSKYTRVRNGKTVSLYGSVYALRCGAKDLNTLIGDRMAEVAADSTLRSEEDRSTAISKGVHNFVKKLVMPSIVKQAKQCALNFDCKPANFIVFSDKTAQLTDFDPSLYALNVDFANFEVCLFVNLLLLGAHIRAWSKPEFSDAFVRPIRELFLELAIHTRSTRWVFDSKVQKVKFTPCAIDSAERAKNKLEAVVNSYFVERAVEACYTTHPRLKVGKPLVPQLLKFVLTGSSVSKEREVCSVLGEV